jgi:DNA-binding response OmpR family regulator
MKVAILEDDASQGELALATLQAAGHDCAWFKAGQPLLTKLREQTFDLLVLDWNVPQMTGLEIAIWAQANLRPTPPLLMLTARTASEDIVEALNAGADDYVIKPVDPVVLVARVNALLRRAYPAEDTTTTVVVGAYTFDPLRLTATWPGGEARLTAKEYALALVFFRNLHRPLGRVYLLETVWGRNPDLESRTLDAHVAKIRGKLDLRPDNGFRLSPVYSYGYRLEQITDGEAATST